MLGRVLNGMNYRALHKLNSFVATLIRQDRGREKTVTVVCVQLFHGMAAFYVTEDMGYQA